MVTLSGKGEKGYVVECKGFGCYLYNKHQLLFVFYAKMCSSPAYSRFSLYVALVRFHLQPTQLNGDKDVLLLLLLLLLNYKTRPWSNKNLYKYKCITFPSLFPCRFHLAP
jgi:hypothetical protein